MMMYKFFNPNPKKQKVGDCVIRAISVLMNKPWDDIYTGICIEGYLLKDMPSANAVWERYLYDSGYTRDIISGDPDGYTVKDFCKDYPHGRYLLSLPSHVVAVVDGDYYDIWDSGGETPLYIWRYEHGI